MMCVTLMFALVARLAAAIALRKAATGCVEVCDNGNQSMHEELDSVGHSVVETFKGKLPEMPVLWQAAGAEAACAANSKCGAHVFSVVQGLPNPQCPYTDEDDAGSVSSIKEFTTSAEMPAGGHTRNYVVAWPKHGCSPDAKCPAIVSLHGHGEHGDPKLLQEWGFLSYLIHNVACRDSLRSALLFPQLMEGESWVKDGEYTLKIFVLPLLHQMISTSGAIDIDRLALVGYSEGAVGAMQGAVLYPHVFTVVAAGSPCIPAIAERGNWTNVPTQWAPPLAELVGQKLRLVAVSFAQSDIMGDVPASAGHVMGMLLRNALLEKAKLIIRLHTGVTHTEAMGALFNRWERLHKILWEGDYSEVLA